MNVLILCAILLGVAWMLIGVHLAFCERIVRGLSLGCLGLVCQLFGNAYLPFPFSSIPFYLQIAWTGFCVFAILYYLLLCRNEEMYPTTDR